MKLFRVGACLFLIFLMKLSRVLGLDVGAVFSTVWADCFSATALTPVFISPPRGFLFFIFSTKSWKLKLLKSGVGVPSIPTGRGTCSTSVPTPLLLWSILPPNRDPGAAVVVVVVVASDFLFKSQGLKPCGLLVV